MNVTRDELDDAPLDGREDLVLNLEREELYQLMLMAHEQDITLNQLVENILQQVIDQHNNQEASHEDLDQ
jgi:hypothetical protein